SSFTSHAPSAASRQLESSMHSMKSGPSFGQPASVAPAVAATTMVEKTRTNLSRPESSPIPDPVPSAARRLRDSSQAGIVRHAFFFGLIERGLKQQRSEMVELPARI